jgi:hypothetical protein
VLADPARPRLYVVGRFRHQLQTLSTATLTSVAVTSIRVRSDAGCDRRRAKVLLRRLHLGPRRSSVRELSLFGDLDNLAWELGDPQGTMAPAPPGMIDPLLQGFHPMKGPMVTQESARDREYRPAPLARVARGSHRVHTAFVNLMACGAVARQRDGGVR